jgi:hypothetical protein
MGTGLRLVRIARSGIAATQGAASQTGMDSRIACAALGGEMPAILVS